MWKNDFDCTRDENRQPESVRTSASSLSHQGRSTLATGILGDLHWDQTGAFGLGIRARVTEPPEAGATLAFSLGLFAATVAVAAQPPHPGNEIDDAFRVVPAETIAALEIAAEEPSDEFAIVTPVEVR